MTPNPRTPQLRDRRFARVRLLANTIFLAASTLSAGMVAYFASTSHATTVPNTVPATTTTTTGGTGTTAPPTTRPSNNGGGGGTTVTTRPTPTTIATVPVTTPTTCHTSASGTFLGCW
jgi:hypothetical protein